MSLLGGSGGSGASGGSGGSGGTWVGWAGWTGWAGGGTSGEGGLYDTPLLADALVRHRDGIVRGWHGEAELPTAEPPLDDVRNLWRWEPWVRAAVIDFDLISHLRFTFKARAASVWHMAAVLENKEPPNATGRLIVGVTCPTMRQYKAQLRLVESYTDLREDRSSEIMAQLGPQNAFWSSILHLHPSRTPKTLELLDAVTRFAVIVEMRIKHAFAALRSIDYSPNVQPMLLTPGHGSFPSGHSTQAYTIARVLANVCAPRNGGRSIIKREYDKLLEVLERQAARVAVNRTVAGVHFPIDSACGRLLGTTLADYLIARSSPAAQFTPGRFKSGEFDENEDFDPTADPYTNGAVRINRPHKLQGSRLFAWLFDQARREWDGTALNTSGPRGRWPAR